jgi:glyoxylase-like metal-dependent hydrolase (beta-lactamase superfamily II)
MSTATYRFQIGQFECQIVQDHSSQTPVTRLLGDAPAQEVEAVARQYGLDPQALDFSMNILLVKAGSHTVLIDTGPGDTGLPEKLKGQGIDPAAIDTVVVTHGHRDHAGGIFDAARNFVYPNARHIISKREYDHWLAPEQLAQAEKNPAVAVWQKLKDNPDRVELIGSEAGEEIEVVPGICAIRAPGHTPGHLAVRVESSGDRLLHIVDAAHTFVQATHPEWSPSFDYNKPQAVETRRRLFERAARDRALVLAYHFTFPGLGHVAAQGDTLRWTSLQTG